MNPPEYLDCLLHFVKIPKWMGMQKVNDYFAE